MEGISRKQVLMADGLCILTAAIWGGGFIASQMAIDAHMSAALIMVLRFVIATAVMVLACLPKLKHLNRRVLKAGLLTGLCLFGAFFTQILGQERTTVSHCAFLTATNVVMVPFLVWIGTRKRPALHIFLITLLTLAGVSVLSIAPGSFALSFNLGDGLSLFCALLFALHLTSVSDAAKKEDVMLVNLVQLGVAAAVSAVVFFLVDPHALSRMEPKLGIPAVLYLGLVSTCLCYFLQTLAQKYTTPSQAGVLLSTEGLFGSLFSVVLGMEAMSANMVLGGLMILASVLLLEYFSSKK